VRSASGDDGRKLFQCGAQRARIQGPRCNEPVRPLPFTTTITIIAIIIIIIINLTLIHQFNNNEKLMCVFVGYSPG
jgi:hypothetical protein